MDVDDGDEDDDVTNRAPPPPPQTKPSQAILNQDCLSPKALLEPLSNSKACVTVKPL